MNAPPIRLDMIFVSEDGVVVAIMSNEPPVSDDFVSLDVAVSAVSELNAGAAAIGLCPADKVGRQIYPRLGAETRTKGRRFLRPPRRRQPEPGAHPPALGGRALRDSALTTRKKTAEL